MYVRIYHKVYDICYFNVYLWEQFLFFLPAFFAFYSIQLLVVIKPISYELRYMGLNFKMYSILTLVSDAIRGG